MADLRMADGECFCSKILEFMKLEFIQSIVREESAIRHPHIRNLFSLLHIHLHPRICRWVSWCRKTIDPPVIFHEAFTYFIRIKIVEIGNILIQDKVIMIILDPISEHLCLLIKNRYPFMEPQRVIRSSFQLERDFSCQWSQLSHV